MSFLLVRNACVVEKRGCKTNVRLNIMFKVKYNLKIG